MTPVAEPLAELLPTLLKRVSAADVRRVNALIGLHREFTFSWAGQPAKLRLNATEKPPLPVGWLRVSVEGHAIDFGLAALPEAAALGAAFAGIEVAALPAEILAAVWEVWLDEPLRALGRHGIAIKVQSWRTNDPPAVPFCGWDISWNGRERFLAGTLHGDEPALTTLAELVSRTTPTARVAADNLTWPLRAVVGRLHVPLSELGRLAAGDVLVLPSTPADLARGDCELWAGRRRLGRALRQQNSVKLVAMTLANESTAIPSTPLGVDQLPVQLDFDVGQLDISVAQLRTLAVGFTFELPASAESIVTIRANGREIGRGELLTIGDRLGVKIVDWTLT